MSYRKIFATFLLLSAVLGLPAEEIHVAFCCDKNHYCEYIGVVAYSIGKNMAAGDELVIYILMLETMEDKHRTKFQQLQDEFGDKMDIRIYDDESTIARIRSLIEGIDHRPNTIGYYILLTLDKMLPIDISKIICLDADVLVLTSLRDFWNIPLERPHCVAGARDAYVDDPEKLDTRVQNVLLPSIQKSSDNPETLFSLYINTGVLLFNLERIRKYSLFSRAIEWARNNNRSKDHSRCWLYDQTAINIVFRSRILECRGKWNTFCDPLRPIHPNVAIAHFAGVRKPWKLPEGPGGSNSPVFIAETPGSSSQPVIRIPRRAIFRASASLQQEQRIIFKEKLLAMLKGASLPREAWNVVQQIPEISDMLQRLGCLQEDLSTLNYDLDIAIVGLGYQASDDSPPTIPLEISVPALPIAICALHASLDPQMDSAPAQGEEIRIKSVPGPWILCKRDSSYQVIAKKNLWALLTFEGSRRRLSLTLYLHPTSSATSEQLESIRSANVRDWDTVRSAFTSEADPAQAGPIADILQLLPRKEELGLVQYNSDEDTVDLQFSSLWHWYREMSPWKHY
jgi:lipopolysaccharide biosynthesis glycosyltransferase